MSVERQRRPPAGMAQLCPRRRMRCCSLAVLPSNGAHGHHRLVARCSCAGNRAELVPVPGRTG